MHERIQLEVSTLAADVRGKFATSDLDKASALEKKLVELSELVPCELSSLSNPASCICALIVCSGCQLVAGRALTFCSGMRHHNNKVWKPTSGDRDNKSSVAESILHSLDSFCWEWAACGARDDDDVTFGDLYVFFRKCPILAFKRTHSTSGKGAAERPATKKGDARGSSRGRFRALQMGSQRRSFSSCCTISS